MNDFDRINELKRLKYISPTNVKVSDLLLKDEQGQTFFEYIVKNNLTIYNSELVKYISTDYNMLCFTIENKYILDKYYDVDLLFANNGELITHLFENVPGKFNKLSLDIINRLFIPINGKYLIKEFLEIDQDYCTDLIKKVNNFKTLYDCLSEINRLDLMKYSNEKCLLSKTINNITMLEELIKTGVNVNNLSGNVSNDIIDILFINNKYDVILGLDCEILVNNPTPSNSYLNMLIEKYKRGENVPFEKISFNSKSNKSIAIVNLLLLQNGINYNKPDSYTLINSFNFSYKPVIIYMLEMNKELTLQNFFNDEIMDKIKEYIAKFNNIQVEDLKNFEIDDIGKYLSKKQKLIDEIKNGNKKEIEEKDIFVEDLLEPMEDGMTLLEFIIKNNVKLNSFKFELSKNLDALVILIGCKYNISINDEQLLYKDIGNNKKLIDLLLENDDIFNIKIASKNDLRIMDYCVKYDRFDIINNDILEELFVEREGHFLAEKYLSNNKFVFSLACNKIDNSKLLKLFKMGYKNILINAREDLLLEEYNGSTILEELLKSNIDPSFKGYDFKSLKIIEILYKFNRPDLMYNASLELLLNHPSKEDNYLQYLIDCYNKGIDVHFENIDYIIEDNQLTARAYIQMTKNGLYGFLNELDEDDLTAKDSENKSLLYYLILFDKDLTYNKLLSLSVKSKPSVYSELKLLGIENTPIKLQYDKFYCDTIYREENNDDYAKGIISPVENLLTELRNLFEQDGKSDKSLIDALVISYRYTTSINPIFIEEEKKKNPDFYYIKKEDSDCFNGIEVIMSNPTISTIEHETGHALHCFLSGYEEPDDYDRIISSICNNQELMRKVEQYSKKFQEIKHKVEEQSTSVVSRYITKDSAQVNSKEIENLLSKSREEQKKIYLEEGYSEETLDIIFSGSFTLEEFIEQKKVIEIGEMTDTIMRYEYGAFLAAGDIIDAILGGRFRSNLLKTEDNDIIKSAYGHGVRYYSKKDARFKEMIANYVQIIKSKNSKETLLLLRYIVGDELVDLLDKFYVTKIIKSEIYENYDKKTL